MTTRETRYKFGFRVRENGSKQRLMISYIKGTILYKTDDSIVVLNNDLGFKVFVPEKRLERYVAGQTVEFHTHEHVREDARRFDVGRFKSELRDYVDEAWRAFNGKNNQLTNKPFYGQENNLQRIGNIL